MRYFYKNKNNDFYNPRLVDNPVFWMCSSLAVYVVSSVVYFHGFKGWAVCDLRNLSFFMFLVLLIFELMEARKHLGNFKRVFSYLSCYFMYSGAITTALLNSKNKASLVNHSYRVLPKIWIYQEHKNLFIKVEKMPGTYEDDLSKLAELISSAVGENWRVTSKIAEDNESWFSFVLSRVDRDLLFVPKSLDDLRQKQYHVKLQNNLIIDFSKNHHLAIFGKTDSGKSTLIWSIILQTISNSDLYFEDFKNEYSILNNFYPKGRFATNTDQIIKLLEKLVQIMNERKKMVTKKAQKSGVIGLTGFDLGMKHIILVVDEWSSVLSSFATDSVGRKQKKHCEHLINQLLSQSRAYAMTMLYANQSPSTDVLSQKDRSQFGIYCLLGDSNQDTQRMVFDQVVSSGNVGRFSGYYLKESADMTNPERIYVPDVFRYSLNQTSVFKKLYLERIVK